MDKYTPEELRKLAENARFVGHNRDALADALEWCADIIEPVEPIEAEDCNPSDLVIPVAREKSAWQKATDKATQDLGGFGMAAENVILKRRVQKLEAEVARLRTDSRNYWKLEAERNAANLRAVWELPRFDIQTDRLDGTFVDANELEALLKEGGA